MNTKTKFDFIYDLNRQRESIVNFKHLKDNIAKMHMCKMESFKEIDVAQSIKDIISYTPSHQPQFMHKLKQSPALNRTKIYTYHIRGLLPKLSQPHNSSIEQFSSADKIYKQKRALSVTRPRIQLPHFVNNRPAILKVQYTPLKNNISKLVNKKLANRLNWSIDYCKLKDCNTESNGYNA